MKQELFNYLESLKINQDKKLVEKMQHFKETFNYLFKKYSSKSIYDIIKMDDFDIILACMFVKNPYNLEEIMELLNKYPKILPCGKYSPLLGFFIQYFNDKKYKDSIDKCLASHTYDKETKKNSIIGLCLGVGMPGYVSEIVSDFLEDNRRALKELNIIFENFLIEDNNICVRMLNARDDIKDIIEDAEMKEIFGNKGNRREFEKFLLTDEDGKDIIESINKYFEYLNTNYSNVIKDYNEKEKERRQHNKNIASLIKELDNKGEIKNIDAILKLCPNDETKGIVLDYIIAHNKKIYLGLVEDYEKTKLNSDENLSLLFVKYGFEYSKLNEEEKKKIKKLPNKEIESLLLKLNSLGLLNINISKISLFKLKKVEELIAKGLINKEWLKQNYHIIYDDNTELEIIVTNIDTLTKESINIIQYQNSLDILKSAILKSNLDLLRTYGLTITRNTTDINFLNKEDLRNKIEFLISLGLEKEDLKVLNYSIQELLKLKIASTLNIPMSIITLTDEDISDNAREIIPSDTQELLDRASNFVIPIPEYLENYRVDNQVLNINGVLISIEKVKRNLAKLGNDDAISCFYAIIYNGYYTFEEIETLSLSLLPKKNFYSLVRS